MSPRETGSHVDLQTGHVAITDQDKAPGTEENRRELVLAGFNAAIDARVADIEAGRIDLNDLIVGSLCERLQSLQAELRSGSGSAG